MSRLMDGRSYHVIWSSRIFTAKDTNLRVKGTEMVFKAIELDEVIYGAKRKGLKSEAWGAPAFRNQT